MILHAFSERLRRSFGIFSATILSAITLAAPLHADSSESERNGSRQPFAPHVEFTLGIGGADRHGFQDPVIASMYAGHLDRPELIDEYRTYPIAKRGAGTGAASVERHFTPWLSVAAEGAIHTYGAAQGHSSSFHDHFVDVQAASSSLSLLVRAGHIIHVAAGPSIDFVDVLTKRSSVGATEPTLEDHVREQKFGWLVDVSARVPSASRAFVAVSWQYRWVGSVEIGPYDLVAYQDDAFLPRTTIDLDRSVLLFGFGARFR